MCCGDVARAPGSSATWLGPPRVEEPCGKEGKRNQETYREPLFQRVCVDDNGSRVGLWGDTKAACHRAERRTQPFVGHSLTRPCHHRPSRRRQLRKGSALGPPPRAQQPRDGCGDTARLGARVPSSGPETFRHLAAAAAVPLSMGETCLGREAPSGEADGSAPALRLRGRLHQGVLPSSRVEPSRAQPSHAGLFRAVPGCAESCPAPQAPEGAVLCLRCCSFPQEHPQLGKASPQEREGEAAKEEEFHGIIPRLVWRARATAGWGNAERHELQGDGSPLPWGITNIRQGKEQLRHSRGEGSS